MSDDSLIIERRDRAPSLTRQNRLLRFHPWPWLLGHVGHVWGFGSRREFGHQSRGVRCWRHYARHRRFL